MSPPALMRIAGICNTMCVRGGQRSWVISCRLGIVPESANQSKRYGNDYEVVDFEGVPRVREGEFGKGIF